MNDLVKHIRNYVDLYLIILSWVLAGRFTPNGVAVGWCVLSYLLILRTNDLSKALIAFVTLLVLSDNRDPMMAFAATAKIGVVLLLVGYVLRHYSDFRTLNNQIFKVFLPFLIFAVLASTWADEPFNAFQKSLSYSLVFFTVPIFFLRSSQQNKNIGKDLMIALGILFAAGLLAYIVLPGFATLVGRYRGLLGNPNGMGILLTVSGPLYFLLRKASKGNWLDLPTELFFIGTFLLSLFLTGSRTSLFAILLFFGFVQLRYLSNGFTLFIFLIVIGGYDFVLSSLPEIASALGLEEYLRVETLNEGNGRFVAWTFAWGQIQEVFFTGGGFGDTELIYKRFFWELSALGHQGNAHNSYLTIWLDTGLIGIVLLFISYVRIVLSGVAQSRYTLPIIYTILFSANFESWLGASLNPFTSLFLISLTLILQPKNSSDDEAETVSSEPLIQGVQ